MSYTFPRRSKEEQEQIDAAVGAALPAEHAPPNVGCEDLDGLLHVHPVGPWRIRELSDETGWWVEQAEPRRRETTIILPTLALAETICAALNGAMLAAQETTP